METRVSVAAVVVMALFMGSITAMLFFAEANFPERTAAVPSEEGHDTGLWNITDASILPLDVNNHSSSISDIEYENATVSVHEW